MIPAAVTAPPLCAMPGCDLHGVGGPAPSPRSDRCGVCHRIGLRVRWVKVWNAYACRRCRQIGGRIAGTRIR